MAASSLITTLLSSGDVNERAAFQKTLSEIQNAIVQYQNAAMEICRKDGETVKVLDASLKKMTMQCIEDIEKSHQLWNGPSGLPNLLNSAIKLAKPGKVS